MGYGIGRIGCFLAGDATWGKVTDVPWAMAFPNAIGMKTEGLEESLRPLLPAYMTMGHTGMDMGKMAEVMPYPRNTISMKGATGPFGDYISMGGLFTIIKIRDRLKSYDQDPGWYEHPPGTVALKATDGDLARDGINVNRDSVTNDRGR